jgi:hypothetical protein
MSGTGLVFFCAAIALLAPRSRSKVKSGGSEDRLMLVRKIALALVACALVLTATSVTPSDTCPAGPSPLSVYTALGPAGCAVSGNVKVTDFRFALDPSSTITIGEGDITVEPLVLGSSGFGLRFDYGGFSVTGADLLKFTIAYIWDPSDIRTVEDVMEANSPVSPGEARVDTEVCPGTRFPCMAPVLTLFVQDNGMIQKHFDSVSISPPETVVGVRNTFTLDANMTGSADFAAFENHIVLVPEPATVLSAVAGLVLLVLRRRLS